MRELSQRSPASMAILHLKSQRLRQLYDPQRKDVAEGNHEVVRDRLRQRLAHLLAVEEQLHEDLRL